ncbi:MAG: hypothetical protein WEA04_01660 [Candidatus Andersenbacteria bacterium]
MMSALWGVWSILTTTFVMPFALSLEPLALSLAHDVNFPQYIAAQLLSAPFSTDPRAAAGHVAAVTTGRPDPQVFIVNNSLCTAVDDNLSYQVIVRNYGDVSAENVTVQFQHPQGTNFRDADPKPSRELAVERLVEWFTPVLLPGGSLPAPGAYFSNAVIITVDTPSSSVTVRVTVFYNGGIVLSDHTINGTCGVPLVAPEALPASPQPAIVCDPGEIGCRSTVQDLRLKLGENYSRALTDATKGFVNCSGAGCSQPDLGPRFQEAVADIIPGDCRVIEDNVISTPQFQDALNRRADPAAAYLFPLYESGQDFQELTAANELLGITHFQRVRNQLEDTHKANWREFFEIINDVFTQKITPDEALGKYNAAVPQWQQRVANLHGGFLSDYHSTRDQKKAKFQPVADTATANAKESLLLACGPPENDGGLVASLPAVQLAYTTALDNRAAAYPATQSDSLASYGNYLGAVGVKFGQALNDYKNGNESSLRDFPDRIPQLPTTAYQALGAPYDNHGKLDEESDQAIRLQQWEVALDTPKALATTCERENVFAPPIATTWCESGSKPEFIIQEAPPPVRRDVRPPVPINGGITAINPSSVSGIACGGQAGDPYWEASCLCHCGQSVQCGNSVTLCELCYPITRHDIFVTSNLECLWDGPPDGFRHKDPYF